MKEVGLQDLLFCCCDSFGYRMSLANSIAVPVTITQPFSAVPGAMYIVLWVIGGALWIFSMLVSKKIFSKKDLF